MDDRALLQQLLIGPASGDALARAAGQTRAAVWKRIQALRQCGVEIEAQPGRGYQLLRPLDLLDPARIRASLRSDTISRLGALEVAWSIDSTNSELLRRGAPAVDAGALVLLAERQTGGRGRRGRAWASPLASNLYLSLARGFGGGLARLGGLSLVAGIAAADGLHRLGFTQVRLKWPNDLVVSGPEGLRKLGGLLVEGAGEYAGPARAVIGLGLNVRMPDAGAADIDQPWCDLSGLAGEARTIPDRDTIVAALLDQLLPALDEFDANGLVPFLPRFAAMDALDGERVTLHQGTQAFAGTALGVSEDGALRVRTEDGREQRVHAGEVSVRKSGTP